MSTTTPMSPRSRRLSSVLPLTMQNQATSYEPASSYDPSGSRPQSPYYRMAVRELHSVLYGSLEKDEIREFIEEAYDGSATFENPLTIARGQQQIADLFCLLGLIPGQRWSELGDVAEARTYDGNRLIIMDHTLHIAFLPFLSSQSQHPQSSSLHPANPYYSSVPSTPYPLAESPGSMQYPVATTPWPVAYVFNALKPGSIAAVLTTVHLKIHTKIIFNEQGKIARHIDSLGIKEAIEGFLPILSSVYHLNRLGIGLVASWTSRVLSRNREKHSGREESLVGHSTSTHHNTATNSAKSYFDPGSPIQSRAPTRKGSLSNTGRSEGLKLGGMDYEPIQSASEARGYTDVRYTEAKSPPVLSTSTDSDS